MVFFAVVRVQMDRIMLLAETHAIKMAALALDLLNSQIMEVLLGKD